MAKEILPPIEPRPKPIRVKLDEIIKRGKTSGVPTKKKEKHPEIRVKSPRHQDHDSGANG